MREILFRGKRIDNGEWVYGYVYSFPPICRIRHWLPVFKKYGDADVDLSTVGQYTGLTDKNGKRIFEEDILSEENRVLVVKFCGSSFCYIIGGTVYPIDDSETGIYEQIGSEYEIIGNIHDNPELVKEG